MLRQSEPPAELPPRATESGRFPGLGGWLKNSFIDFPGTVSTVLFFSECNLRCPYCHNRDLVLGNLDESARSGEIWEFLDKRTGIIEGVVLSGGEPTLRPGLAELIPLIRGKGYRVKLDTNGLLPDVTRLFAPDFCALDVKTSPRNYTVLLGAGYPDAERRLAESIDIVKSMGENAEVRITAAPGIVNTEVIRELRGLLAGVSSVALQPMDTTAPLLDPSYSALKPIPLETLREYRDILAPVVGKCFVRKEG